jgi:hypothetical protein
LLEPEAHAAPSGHLDRTIKHQQAIEALSGRFSF